MHKELRREGSFFQLINMSLFLTFCHALLTCKRRDLPHGCPKSELCEETSQWQSISWVNVNNRIFFFWLERGLHVSPLHKQVKQGFLWWIGLSSTRRSMNPSHASCYNLTELSRCSRQIDKVDEGHTNQPHPSGVRLSNILNSLTWSLWWTPAGDSLSHPRVKNIMSWCS